VVVLVGLLAGTLPSWPIGGAMSAHALPNAQSGKEAVIIEVARGGNALGVARALGVVPTHVYTRVFQGFAVELPAGLVRAAERQPGVAGIWPDLPVEAFQTQKLPTGVDRVDADLNEWADIGSGDGIEADVAVLDTGIDTDHPDLNVVGGKDCSGERNSNWDDGNGHGTHVAGTIAAKDDTTGVVGVAPGARLWAVKVLDNGGRGSWSDVICGLEWVANDPAANDIKVINMSLGGPATKKDQRSCGVSTPWHKAICNVVAAGVSVVVAAGNEGTNAAKTVPATYPEVITVSAFKDLNGRYGGGNSKRCGIGGDDTFAGFSNHGQDIDIAAPGACILSTWRGGKFQTLSGTSMAAPHVTRAVALYIAKGTGDKQPPDVRAWLLSREASQSQNSKFGFKGDPDKYRERVLYLGPVVTGT
jgi:subtilisin family serine protease